MALTASELLNLENGVRQVAPIQLKYTEEPTTDQLNELKKIDPFDYRSLEF